MHIFPHQKSIVSLIRKRHSVRKYSRKKLTSEDMEKIMGIICEDNTGPFGNTLKFWMISREAYREKPVKLGTYGFISGAMHFLVGAMQAGTPNNHEDFGYMMEKKILALTGLGLGTCWIGGSLRRDEYAKTHPLEPGWLIAAISPVGYPAEKIGLRERVIKFFTDSKKRRPWVDLFFNGEFQSFLTPDVAGRYAEALEMVRLAPSANNIQPWRIVKSGNIFHFFLHKKTNEKPHAKRINLQRFDMGIAMCHFELSLLSKGITGHWERRPTGLLSANDVEYISSFVVDESQ
jgi:nitroreductase